jgi:hypothetical protein
MAIDPAVLELVLKTTGSQNVKDLAEIVEFLRNRLDELAQEYKDGKVSEEDYVDASNLLIKTLKEKETILDNVTAAEQRAIESQNELVEAERKLEESTFKAIEQLDKQAKSLGDTREAVENLDEPLRRTTGEGEGEQAEGGFKGLASGVFKAEKAVKALASGEGLGRLGPMLESVMGPLGVPGLGMALAAVAYEAEPAIRAVKDFVDAWDKGVQTVSDAVEAIHRLNRAQDEGQRKRAERRIEAKFAPLQEKLEEQGFLSPEEMLQYRQLERAVSDIRYRADEERREEFAKQELQRRKAEASRRQAAQADVISAEAGAIYAEREAAKKETLDIQVQFNKALQDRRKQQDKEQDKADKQRLKLAEDQASEEENLHAQERRDAAHKAAHETRDAEREAKKRARDWERAGTFAGQRRVVEEEAEGYIQQAIPEMPPGFQQKAAHHLAENYEMGRALGHTMQEQIIAAIMQTRNDLARGMMHGMKRQEVFSDPFVAEK